MVTSNTLTIDNAKRIAKGMERKDVANLLKAEKARIGRPLPRTPKDGTYRSSRGRKDVSYSCKSRTAGYRLRILQYDQLTGHRGECSVK